MSKSKQEGSFGVFTNEKGEVTSTFFIDGAPADHEHKWDGDTILTSKRGKVIYWYTYKQWASKPEVDRNRLIHQHHNSIDDPIVESCPTCSICKKVFNPYWDIEHFHEM